jgi:hypothetical protein
MKWPLTTSEVVLIKKDSCSYKLVKYIILHYFKRAVVESYGYYLWHQKKKKIMGVQIEIAPAMIK